jgi:hypothetical protein
VKVIAPRYEKSEWSKHVGVVETLHVSGFVSVRFIDASYDFYSIGAFSPDELAPAPAPYIARHAFAASKASHIDDETIDRWVDEGVKNVEAQKTLNYEHPSFTASSGDTLVRIENGKAYLYRLQGETNV